MKHASNYSKLGISGQRLAIREKQNCCPPNPLPKTYRNVLSKRHDLSDGKTNF